MNTSTLIRTDLRADFPGLANNWHYLDTAATAQKPQAVIDATVNALGRDYATVHRGVYARSAEMTLAFEAARRKVAAFIGGREDEVVFFSDYNDLADRILSLFAEPAKLQAVTNAGIQRVQQGDFSNEKVIRRIMVQAGLAPTFFGEFQCRASSPN